MESRSVVGGKFEYYRTFCFPRNLALRCATIPGLSSPRLNKPIAFASLESAEGSSFPFRRSLLERFPDIKTVRLSDAGSGCERQAGKLAGSSSNNNNGPTSTTTTKHINCFSAHRKSRPIEKSASASTAILPGASLSEQMLLSELGLWLHRKKSRLAPVKLVHCNKFSRRRFCFLLGPPKIVRCLRRLASPLARAQTQGQHLAPANSH